MLAIDDIVLRQGRFPKVHKLLMALNRCVPLVLAFCASIVPASEHTTLTIESTR